MNQKINNHANLIWSIADKLTGIYKPHEYGLVILPLTVLRRFDCVLEENKDAFLKEAAEIQTRSELRDIFALILSKNQILRISLKIYKRLFY